MRERVRKDNEGESESEPSHSVTHDYDAHN